MAIAASFNATAIGGICSPRLLSTAITTHLVTIGVSIMQITITTSYSIITKPIIAIVTLHHIAAVVTGIASKAPGHSDHLSIFVPATTLANHAIGPFVISEATAAITVHSQKSLRRSKSRIVVGVLGAEAFVRCLTSVPLWTAGIKA